MAIPGFLFGGDTGLTQDQLTQRRRVLESMLARGVGAPRNVGEGLTALGNALAYRMEKNRLAKGEAEVGERRQSVMSGLFGGGETASAGPAAQLPESGGTGNLADPASYRDAIASIESAGSGDYSAVGPTHPKLGRALGRYQVMEANIGPWSKQALGREVSADEFMADPKIQDAVFDKQFNGYVQKYGPEGAAQAWIGGPGAVGKTARQDVLGTSVGEYGARFMKAIGNRAPQEVASLDRAAGMQPQNAAQAVEQQAPAPARMAVAEAMQQRGMTPPAAEPSPAVAAVGQAMMGRQPAAGPQMAAPPPPSAAPQQMAQAQPTPQAQPAGPSLQQLYQAMSDASLNEQDRAMVNTMLEQRLRADQATQQEQAWRARQQFEAQQQQADPAYQQNMQLRQAQIDGLKAKPAVPATDDMREYDFARTQGFAGNFADWQMQNRKAGASNTTINTGEGDKFYENLDKKNAETFSGLSDTGMQARGRAAQIDRLEALMQNAPQGAVGALKQAAGQWGIATEGLSDIQAASALLEKMVPEQRAPGSGPMSDADIKMFRASLPRIINQPGGNQLIFQTMRGITQYETQMGEIADRVANREITPAEGRSQIKALENPLGEFKVPDGPTPNEGWKELAPGIRVRKVN